MKRYETIQAAKEAVESGTPVYWGNSSYQLKKNKSSEMKSLITAAIEAHN